MVTNKQSSQGSRTSAEMSSLIRQWEGSNLKQREFCSRHGIKPHIFWYWLRRYREQQRSSDQSKGFIPIEVEAAPSEAVFAEITYVDGTRLVFRDRVEVKFLQKLLPKV